MCGLVGMAGDISIQAKTTIFKDLLDVCQVRGRDSTGVIKITKGLEYGFAKQVGPPNVLYDTHTYENIIEKGDVAALIGHTRSKTVGEINIRNAHPFDFPDRGIIGVHNGTLRSYYNLDTYHHTKVDSEVLYGHLAANGVDDTFSRIEGAWACVWWDNREKTLNFLRNEDRPLFFTWSEDKRTMFWASEQWMFGVVSRRVKLWDGGEKGQKYVELPVNTLWSFNINPSASLKDPVITLKQPREIAVKEKTVFTGNFGGTPNSGGWRYSNGVYERVADTNKETNGGSVDNPFQPSSDDNLNDSINDLYNRETKRNSSEDSKSSTISNVAFLRPSQPSKVSTTDTKSHSSSKREGTSLLLLSSKTQVQTSKEKQSGASDISSKESKTKESHYPKAAVSHRTCAGLHYITDLRQRKEYLASAFLKDASNGSCTFCKRTVNTGYQIGEILSKNSFLCTDCVRTHGLSVDLAVSSNK